MKKKVSICITTYNHEKYIKQALDSILMQKTNFEFEILIGEDGSKDKTREICRQYAKMHPRRIRLFLNDRKNVIYIDGNATGRWNFINLMKNAKGTYIARCDGDDFWTEEKKLQKMVDFLEARPNFSVCFHPVKWLKNKCLADEPYLPPEGKSFFTADDLFRHDNFIRTSSVVYRNVLRGNLPDWFFKVSYGDISLHLIHSQYGKIGCIRECMGVYRVHDKGIYSGEKKYANLYKSIKTFSIAAENLGYSDKSSFKLGQARMLLALSAEAQKTAFRLRQEAEGKNTFPDSQTQHRSVKKMIDTEPKDSPLVSVIVPTYNRPEGLRRALESIAGQTYRNVEAVVVNDAGEDIADVIEEFKSRLSIKYIVHATNKDLAASRNSGLKNAAGEYIAYLDDDDIFYSDHLQEALNVLTNSTFEVVYSDAHRIHQDEKNGGHETCHMDIPYSEEFNADRLLICNYLPVLTVVHRKSCLLQSGYFDESLHTHEDWDFFIRLSLYYEFFHNKKITCAFSWRYDNSKMSGSRRQDFVKTTAYIYEKYAFHTASRPSLLKYQQQHFSNLQATVQKQIEQRNVHRKEFNGPLVSIVIPLYNQRRYTQKCLTAIFENTIYAPYQVILVDDGSRDDTAEFVKRLKTEVDNIKSIRNHDNLGFSKACNQGAQLAEGKFLVFLNNDTEVQKYWLVELVQTAYNDLRIGAVGPKLVYPDGTIQHAGVLITRDEKNGSLLSPWHVFNGLPSKDPRVNAPYQFQALTAACILIRKSTFEAVNGFDEDYRNGYEDVDLCFKLGKQGKIMVYMPNSVVIHHESKSGAERFKTMKKNYQILHDRWLSSIRPDNIVNIDGKTQDGRAGKVKPYTATSVSLVVSTTKNKPRISFLASDGHRLACPVLRLVGPLKKLDSDEKVDYRPVDLAEREATCVPVDELRKNDILIIQRNFVAQMPYGKLMQGFGHSRPKIVYEFDDAFDRMPENHPGFQYYQSFLNHFEEYLRQADMVTVASEVQKLYYRHFNRNIVVLPNTVIDDIWKEKIKVKKGNQEKVSILFSGTDSHLEDFHLIEPVLEKLLKNRKADVELLFWSDISTKLETLPNFRRIARFMSDYYDYANKLKSLDIDFALVPLVNNDFNKAKTHIKWLEYSACGISGIYADIPAYRKAVRNYKTGIVVDYNADAWYQAIDFMLSNPVQRRLIAHTAQKEVWQKHTLSQNLHLWQEAYERLLALEQEPANTTTISRKVASQENTPVALAFRKNQPLVSIIIPVFNNKKMTKRCYESIRKNTQYKEYEIIFIDNGSLDGAREYLKKVRKEERQIRTILNKVNKGFAAANNQGACASDGKYLLFLNNDTIVKPGWLKALLQVAEDDPTVGAVGSKLLFPDGTLQHAGIIVAEDRLHGDPLLAMHNFYKEAGDMVDANRPMTYQALTAACLLVRKKLFDNLGGFDTDFWNGYEDVDLCFRIRQNDFQLVYQPGSVIIHFESQSGQERWKKVQQNIKLLHKKWIGKIRPDIIIDKHGEKQPTEPRIILPYDMPTKHTYADNDRIGTSIIMLTVNALEYTKQAVSSVLRHTHSPFELIIVDNGSKDGTVEYLQQLKEKSAKVRVVFNIKNRGFAAGNNQGISASRGENILLMNNDIVVTPGWLETMMACMQRHRLAGIVGPTSNNVSGPQQTRAVPYDLHSLAGLTEYAKQVSKVKGGKDRRLVRVVGFCMLIKRAVIEKIGGLDERFGLGNFEDDDFSLRAALAGFESWMAEDCFVHHFGSRTFSSEKIDYRKSLEQNWRIFKQKWGLPQELDYGSGFRLANTQFIPNLHYVPLTSGQTSTAHTMHGNGQTVNYTETLYNQALVMAQNNQSEKAVKLLEKLLQMNPSLATVHNDLGALYFKIGHKDKTLQHYRKAVQLIPNNITFKKNLADFYCVEMGQIEKAMQMYVDILNIFPGDIEALLAMGHICRLLEHFEDADSFYARVLEFDSGNETARNYLQYRQQCTVNTETTPLDLNGAEDFRHELLSGEPVNPGARTNTECIEPPTNTPSYKATLPAAHHQRADAVQHEKAAGPKSVPVPGTAQDNQQQISILIPAMGPMKRLRRCVQAIKRHTSEPHEIVFIVNSVTRGCAKWLKSLLEKNDHCHKVRCKPDSNMAGVFNAGIAASRGEVIVCLSNDVEVTPGWLSAMLGHWERSAGAGLVGAMSNTAESCQKVPAPWNRADTMLSDFSEDYRRRNRGRRIPSDTVDGFCMLMHRKLIEKIGHFDEQVGQGGYEAEDLCLRASLAGYQNLIAGDVYLHRRVGKTASRSQKTFNLKWSGADANSPEGKRHMALVTLRKACRAWQAEKVEKAGELFLQVIGLVPEWPASYYQLARMLIQTRQFQEALEVLAQLPGGPSDAETLVLSASCEEGLGNHEKARKLSDLALEIAPHVPFVMNLQGLLAYRKGDRQTAGDWFERAAEADPGFAEAFTNLGALKWESGKRQAAIDLYERGFVVDPSDYEIAAAYHGAVSELDVYERARPILRDAAGAYPHIKKIRYMRIDCLLHLQAYPEAMAEIEGAMAAFGVDDGILASALKIRERLGPLEPGKTRPANPAVSLCMIIKNEREYLPNCLKSVKPVVDEMIVVDTGSDDGSPDIARAFGAKVSTCNWKGDFSEARNHSLAQASGDVVFLMDADEAISPIDYGLFRRLVRRSSREKLAFIITTRNYSMDNNLVHWVANEGHYGSLEAGTGWTPSPKIRIFPRDDSIHFSFPVHEMVEPSLENAGIVMKPCNLQVHHYGKLNRQKSDQKGEMYYEIGLRKLQETGDAPVALRELAIQAESLKKHEESIDLWMRYIALVPNDPKAYINMGVSYCNLGRFDEVLATAKRVLRFAPDSKEGHYNYALAKLHLGQPQQAVGTLEKLFQSMPEYLPARFLLAAAKCTIGDRQTGITMLEELSRTVIGPGLAIRCHELAKGLVANHKTAYALALLDAAIDSKNSNQEVLELYTDCLEMSDISRKTGTYE